MDIINMIQFLETNFTRKLKTTKNNKNIVTWENPENKQITLTVDENDTTYDKIIQLSLKESNNHTYLYINRIIRRNLTKIKLTDISNITID